MGGTLVVRGLAVLTEAARTLVRFTDDYLQAVSDDKVRERGEGVKMMITRRMDLAEPTSRTLAIELIAQTLLNLKND